MTLLLGARTLLVDPGTAASNKKLLVAPGHTTSSILARNKGHRY